MLWFADLGITLPVYLVLGSTEGLLGAPTAAWRLWMLRTSQELLHDPQYQALDSRLAVPQGAHSILRDVVKWETADKQISPRILSLKPGWTGTQTESHPPCSTRQLFLGSCYWGPQRRKTWPPDWNTITIQSCLNGFRSRPLEWSNPKTHAVLTPCPLLGETGGARRTYRRPGLPMVKC